VIITKLNVLPMILIMLWETLLGFLVPWRKSLFWFH